MNTVSTVSPEGAVTDELAPIALGPNEGESLWFLGSHASIKASADNTAGRVAVIEHFTPRAWGRRSTSITARTSGST